MAETPRGTRVYAIGDIHGRADLLAPMIAAIADDADRDPPERAVLVGLGDYVDRGPDSKDVVALLTAPPPPRFETVFLRGNHELLMLNALAGADARDAAVWVMNGGDATMRSYGVHVAGDAARPFSTWDTGGFSAAARSLDRVLPDADRRFFESLEVLHQEGDYVFVHAGIRPGVPLEHQDPTDLVWIRSEFLNSRDDHGVCVVHGHSPRPWPEVRANRLGVDTGAYQSGVLTCVVLEGTGRRFLQTDAATGAVQSSAA
jgi:serine/threonine protein phosphatase 1